MSDGLQQQHYISRFLIRRWAQDGKVGVICLYHRDSATVSASARTLHAVVELWPRDLESSWSGIESDANDAIARLEESLGPHGDDLAAAERVLSESKSRRSLIDLAVLHHARSLAVPVRQFFRQRSVAGDAEMEAMIRKRWDAARDYCDCGIMVMVLPPETSLALGAVPVFHAPSWDDPRADTPVRFMVPLTPRVVIAGNSELKPDQVQVVPDCIDLARGLTLRLIAEPGLIATPYLICEPSVLEETAEIALAVTQGNPLHWLALRDRIALFEEATAEQRLAWQRLISDQENRYGWHKDPLTSQSMRAKHREVMATGANEIQADLDRLRVTVCGCRMHRDRDSHPEVANLWQFIMPQVVCDAIRQKRKN